jgi:transposase
MEQRLMMSQRELEKLKVMALFKEQAITRTQAAQRLKLSERQISRLARRYEANGASGIRRQLTQTKRPPRYDEAFKQNILELVKILYHDFGPTFAHEKLVESHHFEPSVTTLRTWMIESGLHTPKQKKDKKKQHRLRSRKECFGDLIQIDGSFHDWFEGRAPKCTLLVFIDDATSRLVHLEFAPSESASSYTKAFIAYLEAYGKPCSIYTDKHSVFSVNQKNLSDHATGITPFVQALQKLGIQAHLAHSPQAKGRVEVANKTLQGRLVKELRLHHISTIEEANIFLQQYIHKHNQLFAIEPQRPKDAHTPLSEQEFNELSFTFSVKQYRSVSKNLTIQFENIIYQILDEGAGHRLQKQGVLACKDVVTHHVSICSMEGKLLQTTPHAKQRQHPKEVNRKDLICSTAFVFSTRPTIPSPPNPIHSTLLQQTARDMAEQMRQRPPI